MVFYAKSIWGAMKNHKAVALLTLTGFVLTGCTGAFSQAAAKPTFREPVGKERAFMAELLEVYPAKLGSVDDHLAEGESICEALDAGKKADRWDKEILLAASRYDVELTTGLEIVRVFSKYQCREHIQLLDPLIVLSK
jgi:hypothetical protein